MYIMCERIDLQQQLDQQLENQLVLLSESRPEDELLLQAG